MKLALEDALVDAAFEHPLLFSEIIEAAADAETAAGFALALTELRRSRRLTQADLELALRKLSHCGLISGWIDPIETMVPRGPLKNYAALLRGVAQAQIRHQDRNVVEVVLTPPAKPSKLMAALPHFGFAWADLEHTHDSMFALARSAKRRFVIVSPFIDAEGIDWVDSLFKLVGPDVQKTLIVRGEKQLNELRIHSELVQAWRANVRTFSLRHDRNDRALPIETFHAKIVLSDSSASYVGSANMNGASRDTSLECGAVIRGPAVKSIAVLVDAMFSLAEPAPPFVPLKDSPTV